MRSLSTVPHAGAPSPTSISMSAEPRKPEDSSEDSPLYPPGRVEAVMVSLSFPTSDWLCSLQTSAVNLAWLAWNLAQHPEALDKRLWAQLFLSVGNQLEAMALDVWTENLEAILRERNGGGRG